MHRLRDLNVATKLFAGFGVVCLLLAAVVGLSLNRLGTSQSTVEAMSDVVVPGVQSIGTVKYAFAQSRVDLASAALAGDAAGTTKALAGVTADDAELDAAWKVYLDTDPVSTAADRDAFATDLAAFRDERRQLITFAQAGDQEGFVATRDAKTLPIAARMNTVLDRIQKAETDNATATAVLGAQRYRTAVTMLLVLGALAIVVALVVATLVSRSFTVRLAGTLTVVEGLAEGRLDQRVGPLGRDEVGRLATAVDATLDRLSATMARISGTAGTLAQSSQELNATATQLSSGAEETSAQAQVVSAASEEISVNVGTVAAAGEEMTSAIREIATSTAEASQTAAGAVTVATEASGT
ncbi:MAG: methyl-accepting chemotaxis protein, partial [Propionibacteriaceae bacterium]